MYVPASVSTPQEKKNSYMYKKFSNINFFLILMKNLISVNSSDMFVYTS